MTEIDAQITITEESEMKNMIEAGETGETITTDTDEDGTMTWIEAEKMKIMIEAEKTETKNMKEVGKIETKNMTEAEKTEKKEIKIMTEAGRKETMNMVEAEGTEKKIMTETGINTIIVKMIPCGTPVLIQKRNQPIAVLHDTTKIENYLTNQDRSRQPINKTNSKNVHETAMIDTIRSVCDVNQGLNQPSRRLSETKDKMMTHLQTNESAGLQRPSQKAKETTVATDARRKKMMIDERRVLHVKETADEVPHLKEKGTMTEESVTTIMTKEGKAIEIDMTILHQKGETNTLIPQKEKITTKDVAEEVVL